jgi:hypothetical protein
MVPNPLNFKWKDVRVKTKLKKNVSLIWMVWHQAIVINVWHTKINKDIAMMCPFCNLEALKSLIHRFWIAARLKWLGNGPSPSYIDSTTLDKMK